ncbi:unnamed protein product [Urochloa humidicola]
MSIGTNVAGRNHDVSLDGKLMLSPSSDAPSGGRQQRRDMSNWSHSSFEVGPQTELGAPSGGLQQHRDVFNWRNSSLQMGPQTRLHRSSEGSQTPAITDAPSGGLQQRRNMLSWRKEFLQTPPRAHLNLSSAPGRSSVAKDAPLGGPQQHENMSNSRELSVELLRQTQLYCYFKGRASPTTGSTTGLEQHGIGDMYSSSNANSSLPTPPCQTQANISSGSRIMDNTMNYMINQRKRRRGLLTSMGASPYNVFHQEDARMLIENNDTRPAKRPYSLWAPENYSVGSWNRNTSAFNSTATQNLEQINSATVLEKISHDLLNDIDIEPAGAVEETMVMSTINSLSNLLQQDPAPGTARSSQASSYSHATASIATPLNISAEAAANQVLGVAPDAGSSGGSCSRAGGDSSSNSMSSTVAIVEATLSCEEEEQMGEIDMDPAYLSELLPFCP